MSWILVLHCIWGQGQWVIPSDVLLGPSNFFWSMWNWVTISPLWASVSSTVWWACCQYLLHLSSHEHSANGVWKALPVICTRPSIQSMVSISELKFLFYSFPISLRSRTLSFPSSLYSRTLSFLSTVPLLQTVMSIHGPSLAHHFCSRPLQLFLHLWLLCPPILLTATVLWVLANAKVIKHSDFPSSLDEVKSPRHALEGLPDLLPLK